MRERVPVQATPVALMPPPLAGWAARLDLSRVPDDLALAARQFLSRASELSPPARDEMGAWLAASAGGSPRRLRRRAPRPGRSWPPCWPSGAGAS